MSRPNDFETLLRDTLYDAEGRLVESENLLERLLAAPQQRPLPSRHRVTLRTGPRWMLPLLAAAVIVALAVGISAAVTGTDARRRAPIAPPVTPTLTPPPRPSAPISSAAPTSHRHPTSAARSTTGSATGSATPNARPTVPLPAGFQSHNIYFATPELGWAIGNAPCSAAPGYCAVLGRTTDGGQDWSELQLPSGLTPVDDQGNADGGSCGTNGNIYGPCVDRVAFADLQHGYLWSLHSFYSTSDGGLSWQPEARSLGATQLVIAGERVVRLIPLTECSSACNGELQISRVGDADWSPLSLGGTSTPQLFTSQLSASGDTIVFVSGQLVTPSPPPQQLFYSTDAGADWHEGTMPCSTTQSAAATAGPAGAVVASCTYPVTKLYFSTDSGASFGPARSVPVPASTALQLLVSGPDRAVILAAPNSSTSLLLTTDGGQGWSPVATIPTAPSWPYGRFVTADFGYVIDDHGGLWLTTDGGQNWSDATPS